MRWFSGSASIPQPGKPLLRLPRGCSPAVLRSGARLPPGRRRRTVGAQGAAGPAAGGRGRPSEVHRTPSRSHRPPPPPPRGRPRQILSKGDRSSTGKDSAGFRNVEIRLGAATAPAASAARREPARPPGRARGSAARGGRAEGPGRAGARAPDRARGGRARRAAHPEPAGRVVKAISTRPGDG